MKHTFMIVLMIVLMFSFNLCLADESSNMTWEEWIHAQPTETLKAFRDAIENELEKRENLTNDEQPTSLLHKKYDDFEIEVVGSKVCTAGEKNCALIEYKWSHTKEEPSMFSTTVTTEAYQNGIELSTAYVFGFDKQTSTKIMPNTEYTSYDLFEMQDTTSDIIIYIKPFLSFDNDEVFSIIFNLTKAGE